MLSISKGKEQNVFHLERQLFYDKACIVGTFPIQTICYIQRIQYWCMARLISSIFPNQK